MTIPESTHFCRLQDFFNGQKIDTQKYQENLWKQVAHSEHPFVCLKDLFLFLFMVFSHALVCMCVKNGKGEERGRERERENNA